MAATLVGCVDAELEGTDEAVDDASASIVEAEQATGGSGLEAVSPDAAAERGQPFAPKAGGGSSLPSPGDLRAEPEPDPWNPGGDPSSYFGPSDT